MCINLTFGITVCLHVSIMIMSNRIHALPFIWVLLSCGKIFIGVTLRHCRLYELL